MGQEYLKLIVRRMYDAQKLRIASDLRFQSLVREGIVIKEEAEEKLKKAFELEGATEKEYEKLIAKELKSVPIMDHWLGHVHGIGPRLAGLLVALIGDISRFATPSKLWAYAGLHVKDGKAVRREKGQVANWNSDLRATCFKIATSFQKLGGPYAENMAAYKSYLIARELKKGNIIWKVDGVTGKKGIAFAPKDAQVNTGELKPPEKPEWTLGRIQAMAYRRTVKLFLAHLWEVWRKLEGLEVRAPYPVERLGHDEQQPSPWDFIKKPHPQ